MFFSIFFVDDLVSIGIRIGVIGSSLRICFNSINRIIGYEIQRHCRTSDLTKTSGNKANKNIATEYGRIGADQDDSKKRGSLPI
jgi:hypothetical protein